MIDQNRDGVIDGDDLKDTFASLGTFFDFQMVLLILITCLSFFRENSCGQ